MAFMKLIMAFMLVFASSAQADWSTETLENFKTFEGRKAPPYPDVLTLWGGVKRYLNGESLKGEEFKVELETFQEELELYAYRRHSQEKLPLVVFFPGIFGSQEGQVSPWLLNIFEESTFHTGVVPNFLNKKYIKALPKYSRENAMSLDARAALKAVEKIIEKIGLDNIASVTFLGESLGAFVAASSIHFADEFPNVFKLVKNVVLLWPSLNLKSSLEAFDKKTLKYKSTYESCFYVFKAFAFFKHFIWQDFPKNMDEEDARCFGAYLFHGAFLKSMEKSFQTHIEAKKIDTKEAFESPKNFHEFIKIYNPFYLEGMEEAPEKLELKFWLEKWKAQGPKLKIVSSIDDFINDRKGWKFIEKKRLLDWGEHCAPISLDVWREILTREAR